MIRSKVQKEELGWYGSSGRAPAQQAQVLSSNPTFTKKKSVMEKKKD
jgi:hypothetical protein